MGFRKEKEEKRRNDEMKGFRTIVFNAVSAAWMTLEAVDWTNLLDTPAKASVAALAVAIGNMILRYLTTTSIGKAE